MTDEDSCREGEPEEERQSDRSHGVSLSLDAMLELLADHERRVLLRHLVETSGQSATVNDLATRLIQYHGDVSGERPPNDRIELTLHHIHIPKLVDAGVVDYDARSKELRYWSDDRLERWLERVRTGTDGEDSE